MSSKIDFKSVASIIMFRPTELDKTIETYGLQYRKGKSAIDIKKAIDKACKPKNGFGKIEYELSMLEVYLEVDVFKKNAKKIELEENK